MTDITDNDEIVLDPSPTGYKTGRLTFSPQNLKFQNTEFTAHIMEVTFTKIGNLQIRLGIDYTWKDTLLPNITYVTGAPVRITVEQFDGSKHKLRGEG